jgi:hypothetical protein
MSMNAPQSGRGRGCALLVLLAGVLLITLPPLSAQADQQKDLTSNLVSTIDRAVMLYAEAVDQGNPQIAEDVESALQDLLQALKQAEAMKQHHHRHHHQRKGGAFGDGMGQFGNFSPDQQQQDFLPPFDGGNDKGSLQNSGFSPGSGSVGKGMQSMNGWQHGSRPGQANKSGAFAGGISQASQCRSPFGGAQPGSSGKMMAYQQGNGMGTMPTTGSGMVTNIAKGGSINNGISMVTNNIRINDFNGPTNININSGKQKLTQMANGGPAGDGVGSSKTQSGRDKGSAAAVRAGKDGGTTPKTSDAAAGKHGHGSAKQQTTAGTSTAGATKMAGNATLSAATAKSPPGANTSNGGAVKNAPTKTFVGVTAKALPGANTSKGGAVKSAGTKTPAAMTAKNSMSKTPGAAGATAGKYVPHQQVAQVGKMAGTNKAFTKQGLGAGTGAMKSSSARNFTPANHAAGARNVGSSVGNRPATANRTTSTGKRK